MMMELNMDDLENKRLSVLRRTFGYDDFRGSQAEVIDTVMAGQHALVLMPTGGGKSLCYQVPALLFEGVVIVVSPLIALMQDQVAALDALGLRAAYINSSLSTFEVANTFERLRHAELDILYMAPERLVMPQTLETLAACQVCLFAIDEAHCVSQWGHDFREDYMGLSVLAERFPGVPRLALTATADQRTRDEICEALGFTESNSQRFVSSFDRPNIHYGIAPASNRRQELLDFIQSKHAGDCGIVYCLTRKSVDQTAEWLASRQVNALPYHAGMSNEERSFNQRRFLQEDSIVMVATIAFGMGIDKPDVRYVAHLGMPRSMEGWYQETGRAGRDGEPASAWMRYNMQDVINHSWMMMQSDANDLQKRIVRSKLEVMLGFSEMTGCRRQRLLAYFGESMAEACGNCDNCISPPETYDATREVQMALSCVYRTGQRYGVKYVVDVLRGEDSERIVNAGHNTLSTFGIGQDIAAREWQGLFRQIIALGLIYANVDNYGVLTLTEKSRPVLKGEETVMLRRLEARPARQRNAKSGSAKSKAIKSDLSATDAALFDRLRETRLSLSKESGIAPYMVFHDKTLLQMVEDKPQTLGALAEIPGVGEKKLASFGAAFLEVLVVSSESGLEADDELSPDSTSSAEAELVD